MEEFYLNIKRSHCHILRNLSDGTVTFTLPEEDVKVLYYALLVNKSRASIFVRLSKLLSGLWK